MIDKVLNGFFSPLVPLLGVYQTVKSSLDISNGDILKGAQRTFFGLTVTNLAGSLITHDSDYLGGLMKTSLIVETASVAAIGARDLVLGLKQKKLQQVKRGAMQAVLGAASCVCTATLDSKTVKVVHEALLIALPSGYVAYSGVKDVANKQYLKGAGKILMGVAGLACSAYYVKRYLDGTDQFAMFLENRKTEEELNNFYFDHKNEIDSMYENKAAVNNWKRNGGGISKTGYSHPELPGYIVKIPKKNAVVDIYKHFKNLQDARSLVEENHYNQLVIPESHLLETKNGPILIERKFDFAEFASWRNKKRDAEDQLKSFISLGRFCDLEVGHNAEFLKGSENDPKIGIFDFDCRSVTIGI